MKGLSLVSRLFIPSRIAGPPSLCRSQQLLQECGLVHKTGNGLYALLPLALRVINKIETIIKEEMENIGAVQVYLPCLADRALWQSCGRWAETGNELFRFQDRTKEWMCLQPTHEEIITHIVATAGVGSKHLANSSFPLKLYQISDKFRDEIRPTHGLLRSRIFRMKDLYTFDVNEEKAMKCYNQVLDAYDTILHNRLQLPNVYKVQAHTGIMGGSVSHEYHLLNPLGQDYILVDPETNQGINCQLTQSLHVNSKWNKLRTTEIGHSFYLGTKYSSPLHAQHASGSPLHMGCFGIGVTRLLPAILDSTTNDAQGLRWPITVAPYKICCILPKSGSKVEFASRSLWQLAHNLNNEDKFKGDVIMDDRIDLTIGKRLYNAKRMGYPIIIVAGKNMQDEPPKMQLITYDKTKDYQQTLLSPNDLCKYLIDQLNAF